MKIQERMLRQQDWREGAERREKGDWANVLDEGGQSCSH